MLFKALIGRVGRKLVNLSKSKDPKADRYKKWFSDNGDKIHRLNYQLGPESTVIDLGGYEGQWASDIYGKYRSKILVFEPAKNYYEGIVARFGLNHDIKVFPFGLAAKNGEEKLFLQSDGSSIFNKKQDQYEVIQLKEASSTLSEFNLNRVDLMKINIEGGEYDLLENLLESGWIKKIDNIQVQFHDFVPEADTRMKKIQDKLRLTHKTTYQYPFVWENWKRLGN